MQLTLPNLVKGKFQYQGRLDQDLEEWLYPRGSQSVNGFFFEEQKQESIRMVYLAPEGAMKSNQAPEEEESKMVVIKWLNKAEGSGEHIDSFLCGVL